MHSDLSSPQSDSRTPPEAQVRLPASIGAWSLKPGPRVVTARTIFDYMNGAGELYLAYRFRRLDVYEYSPKDGPDILVELYWMETSDDAFGLLSGDWGGETIDLQNPGTVARRPETRIWPRALYGAGLLRIWSDDLYVRILAQNETAASRKAVLGIGSAIAKGRRDPPPPRLVAALPGKVEPAFRLREDRICYFRSHLVLNSAYFLATSNILDLGPQVEAVTAQYAAPAQGSRKTPARLLIVRYRQPTAALRALARFSRTYLPEKKLAAPQVSAGSRSLLQIEDGWLGYQNSGPFLVLVFECPGKEAADAFLSRATKIITGMEDSHE